MESRTVCSKCKKPIMIVKSAPSTSIGTSEIKQITTFGCLNNDCEAYGVVVNRVEQVIEQFEE